MSTNENDEPKPAKATSVSGREGLTGQTAGISHVSARHNENALSDDTRVGSGTHRGTSVRPPTHESGAKE